MLITLLATSLAIADQATISSFLLYPSPFVTLNQNGQYPIALKVTGKPTSTQLHQLQKSGFSHRYTPQGNIVRINHYLSGWATPTAISSLANLPFVQSIAPASPLIQVPSLQQTAAEIGASYSWWPTNEHAAYTGQDVLIGSQEFVGQGWDIFHPDFFRPDGGYFDFEDTDGNQIVSAGDLLDLDGDGTFESPISIKQSGFELMFQPDVDWLYVDNNANGVWDYGPSAGFTELTPAYGEPIFVADDIDNNGNIDSNERLIRLKTSKFAAIYDNGQLYTRGVNLIEYNPSAVDPGHGTGAMGIAGAGWPRLRRQTGIAPKADLMGITSEDNLTALQVAEEHGVDVLFFEWNSWHDFQDGSSATEEAVSTLAANGMTQVAPAGNLAGSYHCMRTSLQGGETQDIPFVINDWYDYDNFIISLTYIGELDDIQLSVVVPSGETIDLGGPYSEGSADGYRLAAWQNYSDRGTSWIYIWGSASQGGLLNKGNLAVRLTATTDLPEIRGTLTDYSSGWGAGIAWTDYLTDNGSALGPSTADTVIAVGAYGGNFSSGWGNVGERRLYSGIGPRIDGQRLIDLVAPDDPWAPSKWGDEATGSYNVFGGTSGATPHVAGSAALLFEAGFQHHTDIEEALTNSALVDNMTGEVPNEEYGMGKVRPSSALEIQAPEETATIDIVINQEATPESLIVSAAAVDDRPVYVDWDLAYDGSIDHQGHSIEIMKDEATTVIVRAIDNNSQLIRKRIELDFSQLPAPSEGSPTTTEPSTCGCQGSTKQASALLLLLGFCYRRRYHET